ncbi:lytic polysaccharide monooxygenase auxiliary activity family 9 protein [Nocardiopsis sp. LOL_012]|uniref:lytic polysaccharide monooxygenase auxiliary activity family 9 protein n=1 Tax=Nocardiopsis sp. LOL_012 TaxID=3345409 RepID=UPI003A852755
MRTRSHTTLALSAALGGLMLGVGVIVATPGPAEAHGAYTYPASRTYACFQDATGGTGGGALDPTNDACADALDEGGQYAFWNWYGNLIPDVGSAHRDRVADGELCGPTEDFAAFNAARTDWPATELEPGTTEFRHNAWAPHPGTFFTYLTRDGWDPQSPLAWDDLELIDETTDPPLRSEGDAGAEYYWDVDVPDREGRHMVYVVWERSDSPEAFYNCSDVVFGDVPDEPTEEPTDEPTDEPTEEPTDEPSEPVEDYCTAEYTLVNEWPGGFQAQVEVTAGESALNGWMVDWVFANGQQVQHAWNADVVNHGAHYEATSVSSNAAVAAGESTTFGFVGSHDGTNIDPRVYCQED